MTHITNIGTANEASTVVGGGVPFCVFPPCMEMGSADFSPTNGSAGDALRLQLGGIAGSYILPLVIEGTVPDSVEIKGTIVTPQIPYLILHDPPGDGSFSGFEANTTICRSTSTTYQESVGGGFSAKLSVGVKGTVGIVLAQDYEFSVGVKQTFNMTETNMQSGESERCIETTNSFMTSDLSNGIGDGSDVFIGYGETLVWGTFDQVFIEGCDIVIKKD